MLTRGVTRAVYMTPRAVLLCTVGRWCGGERGGFENATSEGRVPVHYVNVVVRERPIAFENATSEGGGGVYNCGGERRRPCGEVMYTPSSQQGAGGGGAGGKNANKPVKQVPGRITSVDVSIWPPSYVVKEDNSKAERDTEGGRVISEVRWPDPFARSHALTGTPTPSPRIFIIRRHLTTYFFKSPFQSGGINKRTNERTNERMNEWSFDDSVSRCWRKPSPPMKPCKRSSPPRWGFAVRGVCVII